MSQTNIELARRGYEALQRGDLEDVAALLDENVSWHGGDPSEEEACHTRQEALAFIRRPERTDPGELVDLVDAGDRVVVILQPPAIDGNPVPLRAQISTFRDEKVIEMVGYPNVADALAAAGVEWQR